MTASRAQWAQQRLEPLPHGYAFPVDVDRERRAPFDDEGEPGGGPKDPAVEAAEPEPDPGPERDGSEPDAERPGPGP